MKILLAIIGSFILLAFVFAPMLMKYCRHLELKLDREEEKDRLYELFNVRG